MNPKLRAFALWTLAILPPDQLSRDWVRANIEPDAILPVLGGFFGLTHLRNSAPEWAGFQGLPVGFSYGLQAVAAVLVLSLLIRAPRSDRLSGTSLGLIAGGAIGNSIDRFWSGEVVDFLRFDLSAFVFPPFNLADAGIVLGVGLLLLDIAASEVEEATTATAQSPDRVEPDL